LAVGVINARFAKPLDRQLILDQARGKRLVVTLEESTTVGGFGSGVLERSKRPGSWTGPSARSCGSSGSRGPVRRSRRSPTCGP
jgi:hypothetical protein